MAMDRFIIAPFKTGLQTNTKPWLIMDDAFERLNNAYVFRGRIRKRFGGRLMGTGWSSLLTAPLFSRFRINLGPLMGGALAGTVPGGTAVAAVGQMFSIGNEIFTVPSAGNPVVMLDTGAAATKTYDTTTGAYVFAGVASPDNTPVWFYPALPVMGLTVYESGAINNQPTYGFDTRFAYVFAGGFWQQSVGPSTVTPLFHGSNINFFWTTNWRGATPDIKVLFITNFYVVNYNGLGNTTDDPIWWFDGTNWVAATGANAFYFMPQNNTTTPPTPLAVQTGQYVKTARIIVAFKNRLLLLNTVENNGANTGGTPNTNTNYVNRVRYSFNGSPFAVNAWYEPNTQDAAVPSNKGAGAGFIDATTEEAIISAEFIKDRLIVYFERSTWELAYTGNAVLPFVWQKINTELGSEAQQSTVPFDKQILTIGNTGVHACNGSNVERIDTLIPDEVFEIYNKNIGVQRVAGIRDYFTELVYWNFPSVDQSPAEAYPARVLVYNYRNGSWAINDDCITAWGYFEQQPGLTWASSTTTWEQSNFAWQSGTVAAQFRQVIAGNQQGFVFIVDAETDRNAPVMQISQMVNDASGNTMTLTIIDHTLNDDEDDLSDNSDFILIENAQGVVLSGTGIYEVVNVVSTSKVQVLGTFTGTYTGGGTATRVSNIRILSKQWNPYVEKGQNVYLSKIDFGVERTVTGAITVDYYPSSTQLSMLQEGTDTQTIQGTGVLETFPYDPLFYPLEQVQDRLWHAIYFQTEGECIQIFLYMTTAQIVDPKISLEAFELEGMVLHTMAVSTRLE
jgi:hypothetical protein